MLNPDAGGGELRDGKPVSFDVQAAEKVFQSYHLTVRNPGGHSSLPEKDNAIYRLAAALGRVGEYEFPFELNTITREYFARTTALSEGELAADSRAVVAGGRVDTAAARRLANRSPFYNALLRTTCVATLIEGGHAVNALPQRAVATINCRILPGVDPASVEQTIRRVVADTAVERDARRHGHPEPALTAAGAARADDSFSGGVDLGISAARSHHGDGRDRRPLSPQCGHPRLWRDRVFRRPEHSRGHARTRTQCSASASRSSMISWSSRTGC